MTDGCPDPEEQRERFAERQREAGVSTKRFINVLEGEKKAINHTQYEPDDPRLRGNYGAYGGRGDDGEGLWLVDVDKDDYAGAADRDGLNSLPDTFSVKSPHTDGEENGHDYYAVRGDVAEAFDQLLGVKNPAPEWGEVRVSNQYCVGPGSQLDGCDKTWCDRCAEADGGYYRIAADREIAVLELEEFVNAILEDLPDDRMADQASGEGGDGDAEGRGGRARDVEPGPGLPDDTDVDERLETALEADDKLRRLWHGRYRAAGYGSDRSKAESALAAKLGWWFGQDPTTVRRLMDRANTQKWCERTDASYRDSILSVVGGEEYYTPAREPVTVVPNPPNAPVELADQHGSEWNWRAAGERLGDGRDTEDDDGLTIDSARQRNREAVVQAYQYGDRVLIEALPTLGKSFAAIAAAADADAQVTYLTNRGINEQYSRARERCERFGLSYAVLPGAWRDCPCFRGEHGEEVQQDVREAYKNGATAKEIHAYAEDHLGYALPCQHEGETCQWQEKWGRIDPDETDVLIGHYSHAHVMSATKGRTVVFDEFPGDTFETQLGGRIDRRDAPLEGPITHFLENTPALDIENYDDLRAAREDEQRRADALGWFLSSEQPGRDPGLAFAREGTGHALAPLAAFTLLASAKNDLGNGWAPADLSKLGDDTEGWVAAYDGGQNAVHILQPPSGTLRYASGVVALDGTPTRKMWELSLGERLNHRPVLTDAERVEYIRDVLEHRYVRTTDNIKPYSGGDHVYPQEDAALLEWIGDQHGRKPALITSQNAKDVYQDADGEIEFRLDEDGAVVESGSCVSAAKHYGNLLGSNEYKHERLGAVVGSRHFGDGFVKKWAAYAGEGSEREDTSEQGKGSNLRYTGLGEEIHRHMTEHQTLQAAMRFGRDGDGAVVYVHTNTLPEWVPVESEGRVVSVRSDGERQVLDALTATEWDQWSTADLAEHPDVEISERQVRTHLHRLADAGHIDVETDGTGFVWRDTGLHRVNDRGEVELEPVELDELSDGESAEVGRSSTYTWDFRTLSPHPPGEASGSVAGADRSPSPAEPTPAGADPPPDDRV